MAFGITSAFKWLGSQVMQAVTTDVGRRLHTAGAQWLVKSTALAPKRTGFLASHEDYRVEGTTLILLLGAYYDIFVEFGTRYMMPHPHVRPALNEINRVFGTQIEMVFNAPAIHQPIFAHQAGFVVPKTLTHKQRQHVATHLMPVSKRHYKGNVRRARMHVRRAF